MEAKRIIRQVARQVVFDLIAKELTRFIRRDRSPELGAIKSENSWIPVRSITGIRTHNPKIDVRCYISVNGYLVVVAQKPSIDEPRSLGINTPLLGRFSFLPTFLSIRLTKLIYCGRRQWLYSIIAKIE